MTERIAVYPGSFDPPTNGHVHTLTQAFTVFDTVHVLIASNADKKPLLSAGERKGVFDTMSFYWTAPEGGSHVLKTAILAPGGTTVQYAHAVGATHIVRGLRSEMDFSYELRLQHANSRLCERFRIPEPVTVFLGSPLNDNLFISSSLIRGHMTLKDWGLAISGLVPATTINLLRSKYHDASTDV